MGVEPDPARVVLRRFRFRGRRHCRAAAQVIEVQSASGTSISAFERFEPVPEKPEGTYAGGLGADSGRTDCGTVVYEVRLQEKTGAVRDPVDRVMDEAALKHREDFTTKSVPKDTKDEA